MIHIPVSGFRLAHWQGYTPWISDLDHHGRITTAPTSRAQRVGLGIENGLHYRRDKSRQGGATRLSNRSQAQNLAAHNKLVAGVILRQDWRYLPEACVATLCRLPSGSPQPCLPGSGLTLQRP